MKIAPIGTKVLIKVDDIEETTRGGIYLPPGARENAKFKQEKGTLVAKGDTAFKELSEFEQKSLKPGARVLMCAYAGTNFKHNNQMYRLCNDKDITAILEENKND